MADVREIGKQYLDYVNDSLGISGRLGREVPRKAVLLGAIVMPIVDFGIASPDAGVAVRGLTNVSYVASLLAGKNWVRIYDAVAQVLEKHGFRQAEVRLLMGLPREAGRDDIERRVREKLEIAARHELLAKRGVRDISKAGPEALGLKLEKLKGRKGPSEALRAVVAEALRLGGSSRGYPVAYIVVDGATEGWKNLFVKSVAKVGRVLNGRGDVGAEAAKAAIKALTEVYAEREKNVNTIYRVLAVPGAPPEAAAPSGPVELKQPKKLAEALDAHGALNRAPLQRVLLVLVALREAEALSVSELEESLRASLGDDKFRRSLGSRATFYRLVDELKGRGLVEDGPLKLTDKGKKLLEELKAIL